VSHADDSIAGNLKRRIPDAIFLERQPPLVEGAAVELCNETPVGPDEVDLEAGDFDIDRRLRQPRLPADVEEVPLELAACARRLFELLGEEEAQRPYAAPPRAAVAERLDRV
jgi:hypothetical protein